jgi:hypothetical protein
MSVAFSPRDVVPSAYSIEGSEDGTKHETEDSRNASCTWCFCSGQDRELSSSQDEAFKLINLRDVTMKYGSQRNDTDPDTEESAQPCDISERAMEMTPSVGLIAIGFLTTAGLLALGSIGCLGPSNDSFNANFCPARLGVSLPLAAISLTLSVLGIKNLVEACRQDNNA